MLVHGTSRLLMMQFLPCWELVPLVTVLVHWGTTSASSIVKTGSGGSYATSQIVPLTAGDMLDCTWKSPTAKWLLAVYVKDVWSRLPALLTSVYGSVDKGWREDNTTYWRTSSLPLNSHWQLTSVYGSVGNRLEKRPWKGICSHTSLRLNHILLHTDNRCFLSSGSPASPPSKSCVVEAICIKLCDKYTKPKWPLDGSGRRGYQSKWKRILEDYSHDQSRLFNSSTWMAETNLALYSINETETTLRQWYIPNLHCTTCIRFSATTSHASYCMSIISGTRTLLGGMRSNC
jgi:hypothetical protein